MKFEDYEKEVNYLAKIQNNSSDFSENENNQESNPNPRSIFDSDFGSDIFNKSQSMGDEIRKRAEQQMANINKKIADFRFGSDVFNKNQSMGDDIMKEVNQQFEDTKKEIEDIKKEFFK